MADIREKLLKESMEAAKKKAEAKVDASENDAGEVSAGEEAGAQTGEEINTPETAEDTGAAEAVKGEVCEAPAEEESKEEATAKDKKDEKIAELNDRLIRNLAEFDNYRKRTDKEKSQMFEMGAKSIIEKILPAIDSFELGLAALSEEDRASGVGQGMEKIYKQLMTILEGAGVKQIEALGKEFDPNLHNAVMHEENEEFGENTVSQELQKGYMYNDSVIRHSMVKVAN
ncbi:MAG: nucleotide exchange factor GrpE [Lachnospiraceae bacterium]|nr:nucleotide exchange factor GrpE [Lachnospiraceae bacterium]